MRHTRSHTKNRRSHHKITKPAITVDAKTGVAQLRHRASAVTGMYRGKQVVNVDAKLTKKLAKQKSKKAVSEDSTTEKTNK